MTSHDTLVVGAGPAGLAVAACLKAAGRESVVLEQTDRVGASWHGHYHRLHLHTPKGGSSLPFLPFPRTAPRYPSRLEVVEYLNSYARHCGIEPRFGQRVVHVRQEGGAWRVQTADADYSARNVVVASGYNREPIGPAWPGQERYRGRVLHSSEYRSGQPFAGQDVLVVGFGNSGGEIAVDLCEHGARVGLSVRSPVNIVPRDILGIPAQMFSIAERGLPPRLVDAVNGAIIRLLKPDLSKYGLRRADVGPATQIAERGRIPLIDVGTVDLIRQEQIVVHPGIERFTEDGVAFTDGACQRADAVVLATGYRARVDRFVSAGGVCDAAGLPLSSGDQTSLPGLYFCGFRVTATGALREIGIEARRIARAIS
jgi:cation diffusion facilitator CzcD-associated flavoprotein CzcO